MAATMEPNQTILMNDDEAQMQQTRTGRSLRRGLMIAASLSLVALALGVSASAAVQQQRSTKVAAAGRGVAARQNAPLTTANIREAETEAGNIVADAVRAAASADIAIVPAAAFRPVASIARPVTGETAAGLVEPASDGIVVLSLRGEQVLAALERSVSFAPQPSAGFLQVSGLRFTYDASKPGGKRVVSAAAGGGPLVAARVYKVATTKPLANGQQGYFQIWDKDQITGDTGKTLAGALADLGKARGGSLSVPVEGRISRVDK